MKKHQIFNLMDTNGRRGDVLNALKIYLEILEELRLEYPAEEWGSYPTSTAQFLFYQKALEKSRDVFKKHGQYDAFLEQLGDQYQAFLEKDSRWISNRLPQMAKALDEAIEKRARHYTSTLVKMGFANSERRITEAGYSYLKGSLNRDAIEEILPLDPINLILFRQLSKLKIFGEPDADGKRRFYSPFFMALALLLGNQSVDRETFEIVVQGLGPYSGETVKEAVRQNTVGPEELAASIQNLFQGAPAWLAGISDIPFELFRATFKSSKSNASTPQKYYDFYTALKKFRENRSVESYRDLLNCFEKNGAALNKAFGYGKAVFQIGNKGNRYDLETFLKKNGNHRLLTAEDYSSEFYLAFLKSKWVDGIREYSDTTVRLLGATGLFQFKTMPELSYREVLSLIFDKNALRNSIFGEVTEEEYQRYEVQEGCYFGRNASITEILGYSQEEADAILSAIESRLKVDSSINAKTLLLSRKSADFIRHVRKKYPKERILELLPLFSHREKDPQIKKAVNDAASVPTIYEYLMGIAWHYLSDGDFDLYASLNLTLNADFEPVVHAGGGSGDIVITYENLVVMLEVTLMNKQAQKRGEWEPVLRHSLNLKAAEEPKETVTFFIADELDYNTVNIWRAVAAASLESTNTHKPVDGVVIMPFTNCEICKFLKENVHSAQIIGEVKKSFQKVPRITDAGWHDEILSAIIP